MNNRKRIIGVWMILATIVVLVACSTKKNTPMTRRFHAITAHYNILYNGKVAYDEGLEAQYKGHKDDYNRLLPMYVSTNKSTAAMGKSNFETAITKSEKAIKLHSIKKRPTRKGNQSLTPKEKEYLARKEFNPYIYRAWLMMADAQFQKGEFFEAASTYNYMLRLYSNQPDIASMAKARLARCYVALEWPYDAEDILNKMTRDSIGRQGEKDYENTRAAYLVQTEQYEEAIPVLKKTIQNTKKKIPRARMNFLLGQLYHELGQNTLAYKALSRVVRANPPYEMAFNARILQTEVMPKSKYRQMISRLKGMARSDKNKDYLDKVYHAMGNIYLSVEDTTRCIYAWEKGLKESTQSGYNKAMLLLRLSQLYWEMENYIDAARTYKDCAAILDKEHEEYKETERRSKILTELEPHLSAIKLQDSLQALAKMPEKEYLAAIDRVISDLKKKEKEEAKKAARNGTAQNNANGAQGANANNNALAQKTTTTNTLASNTQKGDWYFYNAVAMKQGIQEFQRRWGQRPNEDYWRISNKAKLVSDAADAAAAEIDEAAADSLYGAVEDSVDMEEQARKDSLANDPHHREYYLKQIPFTEEQMETSNQLLSDGLYNGGILEQEKLENFPLAEKTMQRLLNDFPEHENMDNIFYHLFLLYGRLGDSDKAAFYRDSLIAGYPESKYAVLLANPNFEMIARDGKHMEDSTYQAAYAAYQVSDYAKVEDCYKFSTDNFPEGKHRGRMMFIRAMSNLYNGQRDTFLVTLKNVVQKFSKEEVSQIANSIVKGIEEGRPLMSDRYDASSIWSRRTRMDNGDSTQVAPELKDERYSSFVFVLAYPTNSLDEDQLLFEMARYNFTNYMVRNFDIEITDVQGITMMAVKGFLSYDEVHAYAQELFADAHMHKLLEGMRTLLISEDNLKMIGTDFSFDEYKKFYDEKFAPIEVPEDLQIDEPTDLEIKDPDDYVPEENKEEEENAGQTDDDDFPFGF